MKIEFDPVKSAKNIRERGLPFEIVRELDFSTANTVEDKRKLYPEPRFVTTGYIHQRLFVVCFTPIPNGIRIISLRKANLREVEKYGEKTIDR
jgi:uncharacterized DUF497 family protein